MGDFVYQGQELDLFARARNWKAYWGGEIAPYLTGDVLEVGAGSGVNTALLCPKARRWVSLEPDRALVDALRRTLARGDDGGHCEAVVGTLADLNAGDRFDAILYIDVLEHIADAKGELQRAATHLAPGGALVILAPAHQWLFTAFDKAIGHYRRYTTRTLAEDIPRGLVRERLVYLDSVGLLASLGNRALMNSSMPTERQIDFWDGVLVRGSTRLDRWLRYSVGKSVLGVWRRPV
jgi:protein-L-isoaspartate O-methyltransferase